MTHCAGYRAAAVAHTRDVRGLGIDAEPNAPLPDDVLEFVSSPSERTMLHEFGTLRDDIDWGRLVFSAKESVFKALYPMSATELEFDDALIRLDPHHGRFEAHLLVHVEASDGARVSDVAGFWGATPDLVATAVVVSGPESAGQSPVARV